GGLRQPDLHDRRPRHPARRAPREPRGADVSPRRVMVVGMGKRVRDVALPAFARAASCFEIADARARSARPAEAGVPAVRALDDLGRADVAAVDLVYVAVSKGAVPTVLGRLARFDRSALDLLIETPVLVTKHFRHARLLQGFRSVSVAEDCAFLPWYDVVRRAADGPFGAVR